MGEQGSADSVSIHAPLAGCDVINQKSLLDASRFQSTHPSRGATSSTCTSSSLAQSFNPRTPRGVRRRLIRIRKPLRAFQSTHPSRGATAHKGCSVVRATFQSTHPSRGATIPACLAHRHLLVSIHAPLAGCDLSFEGVALRHCVSIHAPLAGCDRYPKIIELSIQLFQSTHPSRGATRCRGQPV